MRELTNFSGDIIEQTIFINEFKESPNYDNLICLDRLIKGKAKETIKALLTVS